MNGPSSSDRNSLLAAGIEQLQAGQLDNAEARFREALAIRIDDAEALHLLGLVCHQSGDSEDAIEHIQKAVDLEPSNVGFLNNLGLMRHAAGQPGEAVNCFRKIAEIIPDKPEVHMSLGNAHQDLGNTEDAIASYRKALALKADYPEAYFNLANAQHSAGGLEDALDSYDRALALNPDFSQAVCNRGNVLKDLGRLEDAVESYRTFTSRWSDLARAEAFVNLGEMLRDLGRMEEAIDYCRQALTLDSGFAPAHVNLGIALKELRRPEEAVVCYQKALDINPGLGEAHVNLGIVFHQLGQLEDAIESYRKALSIYPDSAEAYYNLGCTLQVQGNVDEASKQFDSALFLKPEKAGWHIRKALILPVIPSSQEDIQAWRDTLSLAVENLLKQNLIVANPIQEIGYSNFYLAYHNKNNRRIQEDISRLFQAACPSLTYEAKHCRPEQREENEGKKEVKVFSIGILSSFLSDHTIGVLTCGMIQHLSRDDFKVIIFRPPGKEDRISEFIDRTADKVVSLSGRLEGDQRIVEGEKLDILFYPDIGMSPYSYCLAFARLAPVQVVTWGHPVTTGIPQIDYFLSSELLEPSGASEHYSERLITLRNVPTFYFRPDPPEEKYVRGEYGLPDGVRLYVCPQTLFKFHPQFDTIIGDLLRQDPEGRLVVLDDKYGGCWKKLINERFNRAFPDAADRIIFIPQMPHKKFIGLLILADALLDIPTFSGGNSSFEALAMGAPIVTWPQDFMRGRVTAAFYKQMGLSDLIATDAESYVDLALRLAQDTGFKQKMQAAIKANVHKLYERHETIQEMESFFTAAYEAWKTGEILTNSSNEKWRKTIRTN